jgi:hypothetical protein
MALPFFEASQQDSIEAVPSFVKEISAASPKTKMIVPKYFELIPLETTGKLTDVRYSSRRALMGSTAAARRAGISPAMLPTISKRTMTAA